MPGKNHRSTHGRVAIDLPEDWSDATIISLAGPEDSEARPTIFITRDAKSNRSLSDYVDEQHRALQQQLKGFRRLRVEKRMYSGRNGVEVEQEAPGTGPAVRQLQAFIESEREFITVTCTHTAEKFAMAIPIFRNALDSLTIVS